MFLQNAWGEKIVSEIIEALWTVFTDNQQLLWFLFQKRNIACALSNNYDLYRTTSVQNNSLLLG